MDLDEIIEKADLLKKQFSKEKTLAHLLLVDLVDSTTFKSRQHEMVWVPRLKLFYNIVKSVIQPFNVSKYLGDAVLVSVKDDDNDPKDLLDKARLIISNIDKSNKSSTTNEHIEVRIILNSGDVVYFENDPQGTAVDKLFRMEKFVQNNTIGFTDNFADAIKYSGGPVATFPLKGLPGQHGLFIDSSSDMNQSVIDMVTKTEVDSIWRLSSNTNETIRLVSGIIPASEGDEAADSMQISDVNGMFEAMHRLAASGHADNIIRTDCNGFHGDYNNHIVAIGGPCHNSVTKQLLQRMPFSFDLTDRGGIDTPLIIKSNGAKYNSKFRNKRVISDYGVFARCQNPFYKEKKIIIACGVETQGVEGIVNAFSLNNQNFRNLYNNILQIGQGDDDIPDFYCMMKFDIDTASHPTMPILEDQIAHIKPC